jgi:hypothetical protein
MLVGVTAEDGIVLNAVYLAVVVAPWFGSTPPTGSIQWSPGYPIAIPGTGVAVIKGVATAEKEYSFVHAKATYWIGGSVAYTKDLPINDRGGIGPIVVTGLKRDSEYFITIEITQVKGDDRQTLRSLSSVLTR